MPAQKRFTRPHRLLLDESLHQAIISIARQQNIDFSEAERMLLREALDARKARESKETLVPAVYQFDACRVCGKPVAGGTIHQECLAAELKLPEWTKAYPAVIAYAATNLPFRAEVCAAQTADEQNFLVRFAESLM